MTSHEWSEARTDPRRTRYTARSNAAYNAGTGYPNTSGQNGCIQGN